MNLLKTTILCATVLLFVGCASSPRGVVRGTFKALAAGNLTALQENTTIGTASLLSQGAMSNCTASPSEYDTNRELLQACMKQTFGALDIEDIEVSELSDTLAHAMVTLSRDGKKQTQMIDIVKVNGEWKVSAKR